MSEGLLVLGVDAGGTKTDAVVCDTAGAVRGFGSAGRGNWEYDGLEQSRRPRSARPSMPALAGAGARPDQIASSVFALAGLDWPIDVRQARARRGRPRARRLARARQRCVRGAARGLPRRARRRLDRRHGIGHGGAQPRRARRSAPWRSATASAAAASDLVREGLDAIARTRHGQAPPTLLEERYLAALGLATTDELFEAIITPRTERLGRARAARPARRRRWRRGRGAIAQQMGESLAAAVVGVARIARDAGRRLRGRVRGRGARRGERSRSTRRSARRCRRAARPRSRSR